MDEEPEQGAEVVLLPLAPHGLAPRGQLFEAPGLFEPRDPGGAVSLAEAV